MWLVELMPGRLGGATRFRTSVNCLLLLLVLASGIWEFKMALRDGHLWQRFPLSWWWVGIMLLAWISVMVTELRRKKKWPG